MTQTRKEKGKKVLVAVCGGVDSSVTAALLKSQGYDVVGVHLQLGAPGSENKFKSRCTAQSNATQAERFCEKFDIPFHHVDAHEIFQYQVVDYYVHEYLQNRTPNPCAKCNTEVRMKQLFIKANELGCELVATGHYAQIHFDVGTRLARLYKAADPTKDQSYFMFGLTQEMLRRCMMPLGGLPQIMVKKLAQEFGLGSDLKDKRQKICGIEDQADLSYIESHVPVVLRPKGIVRTVDGKIIGEHFGLYLYSVGQSAGLPITVKDPETYFVTGFDPPNQALIVGHERHLDHSELMASQINWIRPVDGLRGLKCKAKLRPDQAEDVPCRVTLFENDTVHVQFEQNQRNIAPGKSIVFYDNDEVLGGGYVDSARAPAIPRD